MLVCPHDTLLEGARDVLKQDTPPQSTVQPLLQGREDLGFSRHWGKQNGACHVSHLLRDPRRPWKQEEVGGGDVRGTQQLQNARVG